MSCSLLQPARGMRACFMPTSSSSTIAPPRCFYRRVLEGRGTALAQQLCQGQGRKRVQVVCMAHPRRVARVASQIEREIGDLFVTDSVIQAAICPERKLGDNTLSAVASITNTYVSGDLQVVKVYVSVYSDGYGKSTAMQNLQRLQPYVRHMIGQRVPLRLTPEIRFVYDDSEEEADLVARIIGREEAQRYREELEAESQARSGAAAGGDEAEAEGGEGEEEDEEDEEDEYEEEWDDPNERLQALPNPFADLFTGQGDEAVELKRAGKGKQGRNWQRGGSRRR